MAISEMTVAEQLKDSKYEILRQTAGDSIPERDPGTGKDGGSLYGAIYSLMQKIFKNKKDLEAFVSKMPDQAGHDGAKSGVCLDYGITRKCWLS